MARINGMIEIVRVDNDFEAQILESIFSSEKIPVQIVHEGAGNYLKIAMGRSNLGVKIFTSKEYEEKAKELVKLYHNQNLVEDEYQKENEMIDEKEYEKDEKRKQNYFKKLLIIIFFLPVLLWLIHLAIR